jgi:8-oxo-dGTP diphosphatase
LSDVENLSRYPRPNVAVDLAVLTLVDSGRGPELCTLVLERDEEPLGSVLPGRFLWKGETVADCARAALRDKAGIDLPAVEPQLLRVFDTPDRDPRGWTLSLAHFFVAPPSSVAETQAQVVTVQALPHLLFDHDQIVIEAVARLREQYELQPDPGGLLEGPFTLASLRGVHDAVLGETVQRDTFRRRMEPQLTPYVSRGEQASRSDGGRPARMWIVRRAAERWTPERIRLPRAAR